MILLSSPFRTALAFVLGWFVPLPITNAAEPNWPVLGFTPVASGVESPVDIQNAGDGSKRLFIVQQGGKIRILKNGTLLSAPLLDVSDKIATNGEQGLLGLAFPPDFTIRKCFYVHYCRKNDGAIIVSRFRISGNPDIASAGSEEVLLVIPKTQSNHNGGQLAFGPDGLLYISTGDGGGQGDPERNSQNLQTRLGKILRIDVSKTSPGLPYAIPPTNPFATYKTYWREILCWGLRNPWRFSFDSLTGDLYIGDVGGGEREEINHIPAASINKGTNFGWSVKEGSLDLMNQPNVVGALKPPAYEYGHTWDGGFSVTGGLVYRGSNPRLYGFYLFADFGTGRVWAMEPPDVGGRVMNIKETQNGFTAFGKDEAGEIYFADYFSSNIYRIDALDKLPAPKITGESNWRHASFSISTDVPTAVIHYTTDGSMPTVNSPVFISRESIWSDHPVHIKAIAFRSGANPSAVAEAKYTLNLPTVKIDNSDEPYGSASYSDDNHIIQLSHPIPGSQIRYTQDGSDPTQNSPLYSEETRLTANRSMPIKAIAFHPEGGWWPSDITRRYYSVHVSPPSLVNLLSELYDPVHMASQTPGAVLHYTTDGSAPTLQSPVWSSPQNLPTGTVIRVLAEKGRMDTANVNLNVVRLSSQKTRFEAFAADYLSGVIDIVQADDSTFYAVSNSQTVWKLSADRWEVFYNSPPSSSWFRSITTTPDGRLTIADEGSRSLLQFQPPSKTPETPLAIAPVVPRDIIPSPSGGFLVADPVNNRIHEITSSRAVATFAGTGTAGSMDGPATQATFNQPVGITRDAAGNIFVAEGTGSRIRIIDANHMVTTLAGDNGSGWIDGPLANARFDTLRSIACDRIGNLYISSKSNTTSGKIRKIRPDGEVTTLRGPLFKSGSNTILTPDSFGVPDPQGVHVDDNGVLYIVGSDKVMKAIQEDWDNDGIPDETETALGAPFVVGVDDRLADSDGDLFSNCAEWISGTNALLASSQPDGRRQIELKDATVSLNLPCGPGKTQQLEYSDDMKTWRPMGVPVKTSLKSVSARLPVSPLVTQRFYRLTSTP